MKRYLITTADQRTWVRHQPALFLGEWCQRYDARDVWSQMDAVVAPPYGIGREQKARDHAYIYGALLPELLRDVAAALNALHGCRHSLRYWQIVIGPWLQNYAQTLFNRYYTLEQALNAHEVSATMVLDAPAYCAATCDAWTFVWATNDDVWNHVLWARLIRERGDIAVEIDGSALRDVRGFTAVPARTVPSRDLRRVILRAANAVLPRFVRKHDALIINSYLPKRFEVALQVALGQCPQLWGSPDCPSVPPDPELRRTFVLGVSGHQGFERFVRTQLPDAIPTRYLEGYAHLVAQAGAVPWPKAPKFIFTSNSFAYDDVFKVYAGRMAEQGVPYFVGAHGSFGLSPYVEADNDSPEVQSSDKYFTWGWVNENPRIIPAFLFKAAGRKPRASRPHRGGLLLVEVFVTHRKTHWDGYYEHGVYQEEQFRFVEALPAAVRAELTVRLHSAHQWTPWCDVQRWKDRSPETRIDTGKSDIRDLISGSRLVVYSYDSTGIPETLSLNIPTMCFWYGGLDHLFPSAIAYYELLRDAGIVADSPEQAAALIASRWDNVSDWWDSAKVQAARRAFCDRICRAKATPVRTMRKLLREACASTRSDGKGQLERQ